ncbi:hypothetical protein [Chelatococcus reniformis]|uniref:Uncharacterized protein n=1 Tax=Chelatococcus reniformis TaxID=1494448 RepID=A0A916XGM6_9HYPH|nr:hypothetical protein [Chelatococcus reniformis]GGC70445.1 hypothetical protein GCM10010994_31220 [Chelatococcus reniformis]
MSAPAPIAFTWDGEVMVPLARFTKVADRQFVIGERYVLVPHEERSGVTHRHFFAIVNEAWSSLPEQFDGQFPSAEHLRKFALIRAGFRDERTIVCSSKAEAIRIAAFVRSVDEFSVVQVHGATVIHHTAQSQSTKAMGKRRFQESKDAVFAVLAAMLGVDPTELRRAA